jgi:hypothetical protein
MTSPFGHLQLIFLGSFESASADSIHFGVNTSNLMQGDGFLTSSPSFCASFTRLCFPSSGIPHIFLVVRQILR